MQDVPTTFQFTLLVCFDAALALPTSVLLHNMELGEMFPSEQAVRVRSHPGTITITITVLHVEYVSILRAVRSASIAAHSPFLSCRSIAALRMQSMHISSDVVLCAPLPT